MIVKYLLVDNVQGSCRTITREEMFKHLNLEFDPESFSNEEEDHVDNVFKHYNRSRFDFYRIRVLDGYDIDVAKMSHNGRWVTAEESPVPFP